MERRQFLRAACAGVAAAALTSQGGTVAAARRRPNVIIIYTDDQGTCDLPSYGSKDLVTPNIESLVKRGTRFTQFYAPGPVCSPSRAGLLTGRYPLHAGLPNNSPSERGHPGGLPSDQVTIAEMMKAAGYATAHIGKWHLGYQPDKMPNAQGFDFSFGFMGGCIDNYSHFFYWSGPNAHDMWRNGKEVYEPGKYFPDLMVEEASKFLEAHRDEPFFMYYAMNNPHYPYQGKPKWLKYYNDKGEPYPRNLYAAFISTLDERVGKLLDKVDELGLRDDTIIIFQSDQGYSTEERAHYGGGNAGPYRGAKFSMFEGGIRIPAIISWPGHLPEGAVRNQMAIGCDWMPTIAELCGVPLPKVPIDGKSIVPLIKSADAPTPHKVLQWQSGLGKHAHWAVREGDWKLLGNPQDTSHKAPITRDDKLFLVNLKQDVTEMRNLAKQYPDKVAHLEKLHDDWIASLGS